MKLKDSFITHTSGGEQIMVSTDPSFSGLVRSNRTAAFIVDCLKAETTPEEITARLQDQFEAPEEMISADVCRILDRLRCIGALDE